MVFVKFLIPTWAHLLELVAGSPGVEQHWLQPLSYHVKTQGQRINPITMGFTVTVM